MCGIVGYIGAQQAQDILLDGLSRLEYRGYDSAGIAVMDGGIIRLSKAKGRLANLAARVASNPLPGTIGIGHTRWATHGEPNDINAHPHTDMKGHIAVVHNGIIENYEELRAQLKAKGCVFVSETDTEVIAHLLHTLYDGDMLSTILRAQTMLEGSYALCVLNAEAPDTLYCTRKDSPLVVGLSDGAQYVGSDIPALIRHTRTVELLDEREVAVLTRSGVRVYDHFGNERALKPIHVDWDVEAAEKGGYAHFMLKEIFEQPKTIVDCIRGRINPETYDVILSGIMDNRERFLNARRIIFVACGTSWHASLIGEYLIEDFCRIPVEVEYASEFRYRNPVIYPDDIVIAVSQSGETADTLAAIELAKQNGAFVYGICNVIGSSIARATDSGTYIHVGPEIGVASTKAFTGQVTVLTMLALMIARVKGTIDQECSRKIAKHLLDLPAVLEEVLRLNDRIADFSKIFTYAHNFIYLGRGYNYPTALEGALKLKEISYIHAEGYPAAEMKHGPIALIDAEMPTIAIATPDHTYEKTASNIEEIKARGGKVITVIAKGDEQVRKSSDYFIEVPVVAECLMPIVVSVPLQLLAYHIAVNKGRDVDQPRNLAKSVTVE